MMEAKPVKKVTEQNQYEVDLNAIKRKHEKSEYTDFVQVRLTKNMKKDLVEFCREEKIYVGALLREMVESYLKQIKE